MIGVYRLDFYENNYYTTDFKRDYDLIFFVDK